MAAENKVCGSKADWFCTSVICKLMLWLFSYRTNGRVCFVDCQSLCICRYFYQSFTCEYIISNVAVTNSVVCFVYLKVMFQVRKDKFKDHVSVVEDLELVDEDDQFTHMISLDEVKDGQDLLSTLTAYWFGLVVSFWNKYETISQWWSLLYMYFLWLRFASLVLGFLKGEPSKLLQSLIRRKQKSTLEQLLAELVALF